MNFGEITDAAIAQVVSVSMTDRLVNTNRDFVQTMINKGYHLIERTALWKFSERDAEITAAPGTRVCADVPADLGVPLMVYSNRLRTPLGYHDERQRFQPLDQTGKVQEYAVWGDEFRFYPLPTANETFVLRYYGTWADLSNDADIPVIPATFHDLLIDYGTYHLALRVPPTGDRYLPFSSAQPYLEGFKSGLMGMLASDLVMKTFDEVPNYGFNENVLGLMEW